MASNEPVFPPRFALHVLNNGTAMPTVGFGTFKIRNENSIMKSLDYALDAGYRMFDTASVYGNEIYIGSALNALLPKYGLEREDIFITTKLSPSDHGGEDITSAALRLSLDNLGLDYVDLYLVHFPGSSMIHASSPNNCKLRDITWRGLCQLYDVGFAKAIGVSNYTVKHLQELMKSNHGVVPAVNQVEWHPYYHEDDLLKFCKESDIVVQAYGSLGGANSNRVLLQDKLVIKIAKDHNATCAQVLLVWALQQDVAVIPKSTDPVRIKENITLNFKLTDDEMNALNALGPNKKKFAWDPHTVA